MRLPDKNAVRLALELELSRTLETMAKAARASHQGAVHEDSRAEGDKDMRSTEQSYLARGQAMRVEDIAEQLQRLQATALPSFDDDAPLAAFALVVLEIEGQPRVFFIVPYGGGAVLSVDGTEVTVITPSSPVGRALLGRRVGEDFELVQRGQARGCVIAAVA
jgi:transcription elongation GreA/GreB family factor